MNLEYVLQEASDVLDTVDPQFIAIDADEQRAHTYVIEMLSTYVAAIKTRLYESDSIPKMFEALCSVNKLLNDGENNTPFRLMMFIDSSCAFWCKGA